MPNLAVACLGPPYRSAPYHGHTGPWRTAPDYSGGLKFNHLKSSKRWPEIADANESAG
jgi:hypothetical protein